MSQTGHSASAAAAQHQHPREYFRGGAAQAHCWSELCPGLVDGHTSTSCPHLYRHCWRSQQISGHHLLVL